MDDRKGLGDRADTVVTVTKLFPVGNQPTLSSDDKHCINNNKTRRRFSSYEP